MVGSDGIPDAMASTLHEKTYRFLFIFALILALIFIITSIVLWLKTISLKGQLEEMEKKFEKIENKEE